MADPYFGQLALQVLGDRRWVSADSSPFERPVEFAGSVTVSTAEELGGRGVWVGNNQDAGNTLQQTANAELSGIGAQAWCFDAWVYQTQRSTTWGAYLVGFDTLAVLVTPGGQLLAGVPGSADLVGGSVPLGALTHVEVSRDAAGVLRLFVAGQLVAEQTGVSGSVVPSVIRFFRAPNNATSTTWCGGFKYLRFVVGSVRHTANFDPPTESDYSSSPNPSPLGTAVGASVQVLPSPGWLPAQPVIRAHPGHVAVAGQLARGSGRISGTLKVLAVPSARAVRLHDRRTGQLLRQTVSAADGTYGFGGLQLDRPYLVVGLDDVGQPNMVNAAVADMVEAGP